MFSSIVLLGSVATGVFSKYQNSYDNSGEVTAKKFIINASEETSSYHEYEENNNIVLAPGEYFTRNFSIRNYDNNQAFYSEVDVRVKVSITWGTTISPLSLTLYRLDGTTEVPVQYFEPNYEFNSLVNGFPNEKIGYEFNFLTKNQAQKQDFRILIKWDDTALDYDSEKYKDCTASYKIDVTGTQSVGITSSEKEFGNGFHTMLNDPNSSANYYFSLKNSNSNFVYLNSAGVNFGQARVTPELAELLGEDADYLRSNFCYRIASFPKSRFGELYTANWRYNIFFAFEDITRYANKELIKNVYFINARTGFLERGTCPVAYDNNNLANIYLNGGSFVKEEVLYQVIDQNGNFII